MYSDEFDGIKILFSGGDLIQQKGSLLAIHQLLPTLVIPPKPMYRDRVILIIDKPNADQKNNYRKFKEAYPYLFSNNQVFKLDTETLEEYYPSNFKKNRGDVSNEEKVKYARYVAKGITQQQFEEETPILFAALQAAKNKGFQ